jgi:TRAP-type C4-dicarboxylate transport system substrate-binding protein
LVSFGSALDAIKGRVAEIVVFPATMFVNDFPVFQCTALPIGVDLTTEKDYNAVFDMMWAFINKYPEAQAEFKNFKLLWPITTPSSYWAMKNKEIHLPTDLKGMKIGAGGPPVDIVEAYGGANVNEIPPEAYMNMDKGVIDGTILSWGMSNDYKMHELVKYYFTVNLGNGTLVLAMNQAAWNEMSAADQKILTQTVDEAIRGGSVQGQLESEKAGKDAAEKSSKIYAPTAAELIAWNEAAMVAANKWVKNAESAGVVNPMNFYNGFQALQKQYFPDQKK